MAYLHTLTAWIAAHPEFAAAIIWPLITAVLNWFVKPRDAQAWAVLHASSPLAAQLVRFVAATGLDPVKAVDALKQLVARKGPPPTGAVVLLVVLLPVLAACDSWRQAARTVLDVVQVACVIAHQELPETDVAKVCGVADDLLPPMRRVLAESRAASAKAAAQATAGACGGARDGGAP